MDLSARPFRSVLYLPGSKERALEKARTLAADALILDLEDAVAPAEKPRARELVGAAVEAGGYGRRLVLVRTNGMDTEWGAADLARACAAGPDGILLPKVERPGQLVEADALMRENGAPDTTRLWAMMETPRAMMNAASIAAAHPRLAGFVMGTNDLVKDLGAAHVPGRLPVMTALGLCLLAARAEGLVCVDGVHNAFRDEAGLRRVCVQARDMGFDGKTLIHPAQIDVANEVFAPSDEAIGNARAEVAVFDEAMERGEGVAVLNGRIVENLHVEAARRLLGRAAAIVEMSGASAVELTKETNG